MSDKSFEDELLNDISNSFASKSFMTAKASYLYDSSAMVKNWISSGDYLLDVMLSNQSDGGFPVGRLVEISGDEGCGKSLLAAYTMAETQKKGGVAILIDTEHAASLDVLERVGVNVNKLMYIQAGTVEEVFDAMEKIVTKITRDNVDRLITIVWDSVAATSNLAEVEGDMDDKTVGLSARLIGKGLRKYIPICSKHNVCLIFLNQLRTKIGITFGDDQISPGGRAIPFHASIMLRLKHKSWIVDKVSGNRLGRVVKCTVKKNKVAPPTRSIEFALRWGDKTGAWIDHAESIWAPAIKDGIFKKKTQQTYAFTPIDSSTEITFSRKKFGELYEENEFKEEVHKAIAKSYILSKDTISDKLEIEDSGDED